MSKVTNLTTFVIVNLISKTEAKTHTFYCTVLLWCKRSQVTIYNVANKWQLPKLKVNHSPHYFSLMFNVFIEFRPKIRKNAIVIKIPRLLMLRILYKTFVIATKLSVIPKLKVWITRSYIQWRIQNCIICKLIYLI